MTTQLIIPPESRIIPLSVLVHWSESKLFNDDTTYAFDDFENMALEAAMDNLAGGYDKTRITVFLSDNSEYQCRLDLGIGNNDLGFSDRCLRMKEYHQLTYIEGDRRELAIDADYIALIQTISNYCLNEISVMQTRKQVAYSAEQIRMAKERSNKAINDFNEEAKREYQTRTEAFQASIQVPSWANAVIIATFTEHDDEGSDPYDDYYQSKTTRTIILAWSKHTRMLFPELRKACLNHPDTSYMNNKDQSKEHRQHYSMGAGYFLTDNDYIRNGWHIQKHVLPSHDKAQQASLGELAVKL